MAESGPETPKRFHRVPGRLLSTNAACMLMIMSVIGCATSSNQLNYVNIEVNERGVVRVADTRIMLENLPKHLKTMGVTPQTRITISLPKEPPRSLVFDISKMLTVAGYYRYKFKSPWKTSSSVRSMDN